MIGGATFWRIISPHTSFLCSGPGVLGTISYSGHQFGDESIAKQYGFSQLGVFVHYAVESHCYGNGILVVFQHGVRRDEDSVLPS